MNFNFAYFLLLLMLLITEIFVAGFMHDALIRPYGGDLLVVIMLYCFFKDFKDTPVIKTAALVLLFAYAAEISQYFHLARLLTLQRSGIALLILGSSFSFIDILFYFMGILLVITVEKIRSGGKMSFNCIV